MPTRAKEKRMNQYQIEAQAQLLSERFGMEAQAVVAVLKEYWKDRIASIWTIEDVAEVSPGITDEDAMAVLDAALDNHDANIGINWDVLRFHAENLGYAES
jgi:hypothetical protein